MNLMLLPAPPHRLPPTIWLGLLSSSVSFSILGHFFQYIYIFISICVVVWTGSIYLFFVEPFFIKKKKKFQYSEHTVLLVSGV